MLLQILTTNDTNASLSLKISKKLIKKPLKVYIDFEKDENNQVISQEDFLKLIDDAEKSPTISLETCNKKWQQKTIDFEQYSLNPYDELAIYSTSSAAADSSTYSFFKF